MRFHVKNAVRLLFVSLSLIALPVIIRKIASLQSENLEDNVNLADDSATSESQKFQKVPFHEFEPNQPKFIVILTYQRCGSSPVGQFFNTNPDMFYFFEPIDSLYSSLYGTNQGWNIPSDITTYENGTERILPAMEKAKISHFLRSLLSCDLDSLPTETLVDRFFFTLVSDFSASINYISCLEQKKLDYTRCESFTEEYCGARFGEKSEEVLATCNRLLHNATLPRDKRLASIHRKFANYRLCMNQLRLDVSDVCQPMLQEACSSRRTRVAKVVRAPMESMEPLLKSIPNFRVIHLIRDPRAVILSRKEFDSSARGLYAASANDSMTREAVVYCRDVVRDIKVRQQLETIYPGKIYTVIHDEIFTSPVSSIQRIYHFVDERVSNDTWEWLSLKRSLGRGLFRWQDQLTFQQTKEIFHVCRELFQLVHSDKWLL